MAILSYPGVYVDEVSSGVRPIALASTSTAAFIGRADKGPLEVATKVYNFTEYQVKFGGYRTNDYLTRAVYQFFNNGGAQCYIVGVARANVGLCCIAGREGGLHAQIQSCAPRQFFLRNSTQSTWAAYDWGTSYRRTSSATATQPTTQTACFRHSLYTHHFSLRHSRSTRVLEGQVAAIVRVASSRKSSRNQKLRIHVQKPS